MKHYGDICKINGAEIEPVDVITFGAPCQDLSIAGRRAGMKHESVGDEETTRSGLFYEAIRVIKEMRENDIRNGRTNDTARPRYAVYENVPGALSSNKGEDFRCVLEETARIVQEDAVIPRPDKGGGTTQELSWETGGQLLGEYTMHSFGESPKEENVSLLSQILVEEAHPKYSLSAKACRGILNRANRRGKALPEVLRKALEAQIENDGQVS